MVDMPSSLESEEAVLSSILQSPEVMTDVLPIVSPDDFHRPENRNVYSAMCGLWADSKKPDPVLLANAMKSEGTFNSGSIDYIASLIGGVPSVANVASYAEVVREKAMRRRIIATAERVASSASAESLEQVMADTDRLIMEVGGGAGGGFSLMKKSIWPAMERLESLGDQNARGILTGFVDLDRLLVGFEPGDLIVVAARPSMGKTALAMNMATNVALNDKKPVAVVSLEMDSEALTMRCIASEARVDLQKIRNGAFTPEASSRMAAAAGHLDSAPIYIDETPKATVPEIAAKLDSLVRGRDVKLVVIDYLQLMSGPGETRTQEISKITRDLKLMAKSLGVPVMVLSQLSRAVEARSNKRPMLSDLRESGSIEQDADVVMFVYRPEYYMSPDEDPGESRGLAEVIVSKQRNGPVGSVGLHFTKEYARFDNLDRGYLNR